MNSETEDMKTEFFDDLSKEALKKLAEKQSQNTEDVKRKERIELLKCEMEILRAKRKDLLELIDERERLLCELRPKRERRSKKANSDNAPKASKKASKTPTSSTSK